MKISAAKNPFGHPKPGVTVQVQCVGESVFSMQLEFFSLNLKLGSLYHFLAKCGTTQTATLQREFRIDPSRIDLTAVFFYGRGNDTSHNMKEVILRVKSPTYGYAIVFTGKEKFLFSEVKESYYKQKTINISRDFSPFKGANHPRPLIYNELECFSSNNSTKSSAMSYTFYLISNDLNKAYIYRSSAKCGKEVKAFLTRSKEATEIDY